MGFSDVKEVYKVMVWRGGLLLKVAPFRRSSFKGLKKPSGPSCQAQGASSPSYNINFKRLVSALLESYRHQLLSDERHHLGEGFGRVWGWFWDGFSWFLCGS